MTILETIRAEKNFSHKDMIKTLGISKAYYSMLRRGSRPISKTIADKLKSVFGIPYEVSFCPAVHKLATKTKRKKGV